MEHNLYCCFSVPLRNYLTENNIRYELVAKSPNTSCLMWIYIKNENLKQYLNKWSTGVN